MIHRYLYDVLKNGWADIVADPTLIDDLFEENYVLESTEVTAIKQYVAANELSINNGYPRDDTQYPALMIILADEGENDHFLGDSGGMVDELSDPNYGAEILVSVWAHTYQLMIATDHPDITAYYYEIVKFIILNGQAPLADDGCFEFQLNGQDLAPDPRYIPAHLFVRRLVFQCNRPFQRIDKDNRLRRGRSVSGIHVDSSGSPSDVGGVNTNVTTYNTGEEDE